MRILRVYLLREIMGLFALSLVIVTVLFMSQRIIQLTEWALNRGVGVQDMGRLMIYLLPSVLVIIVPIVTLFSILLGIGRLSSDNEITALKSAGIGLYRLLPPALLFAIFASTLALFASEVMVPEAARASRLLRFRIIRTLTESAATEKTFSELARNTTFYIREKRPDGELRGVMAVVEKWPDDQPWKNRQVVFAARGRFVSDPVRLDNELWLYDGTMLQDDRETGREEFAGFTVARLKLDMGNIYKVKADEVRPEMDLGEMASAIAALAARSKLKGAARKELLDLRIQWHERLAFPLGCLALCFWAVPLGIQPPRAGRARAIVVSIMLSGAFYYLMILSKFAALEGWVTPGAALWFPDLAAMVSGAYMLRQKNRERPVVVLTWLEDWVYYWIDRVQAWRRARG